MEYLLVGGIGSLIWLAFWGLILYGVWVLIRNSIPALEGIGPEDLSPVSAILTLFLILAVLFLFQQAWNDLGRLAGQGNRYDAELILNRLIMRAVFVCPAAIIALVVYFLVKGKGVRYGVITLPYFIASLIFLVRLLFDAGKFVLSEYKVYGIYIVLVFIIIAISALIFFIQRQYEGYKQMEEKTRKEAEKQTSDIKKDSLPGV